MKAEWPSICPVHVMLALLWRGLLFFIPVVTTLSALEQWALEE